jgi:anti-sigma regulatory factor (Ser/Thr protein kinase)
LIRVGVAVQESLVNAIEHGCLEVDATLPDGDPNARQRLLDERRNQPPYCDRQVYVRTHLTVNEATITIRDEGPGFDVLALPDPTDPDNILRLPGRGRLLIHSFMDAVQFNAAANEITLVKRQLPAPRPF